MSQEKEIFNNYLKEKGIRQSRQRAKILDIFLKTHGHLTVAELYGLVRKKDPGIGYATVYRTIKVICAAGLARKVVFGDGVTRYEHEYGHEHHDHLICLECGKFVEAVSPEIEKLQEKLAKKQGFTLVKHRLQMFGTCRKCTKERS